MKEIKKIIILGTGGNSIDILDTINDINLFLREKKYECIGFLDDNESNLGKDIIGVKVLGPLNSANKYDKEVCFVNGIGSPSNFLKKEEIIKGTEIPIERFETIIHPTASVSNTSKIGKGVVIFQNVTITSNVSIGNHVIILPNTVISHDDIIGDYTCITGGVCISGNVKIGKLCYLGTNSTIKGSLNVGNFCLVGMGSVILKDIPENSVFVGNPGKFLRHSRS